MKRIDINEVQKRRYETFEKEKNNLILTKIDGGYSISNLNKGSIYTVTKDSSGKVQCTCKDYVKHDGLIRCKHIISVSKKADRTSKAVINAEDNNININKEENNMESNQNNSTSNNINNTISQENTADIKAILSRPFPKELIRYREGQKKKQLAYVETAYYIDRLNEAFCYQWTWEILSETITEFEVFCKGKLTVKIAGQTVIKETYGGKDIIMVDIFDRQTRQVTGKKPFSIADDLKSASSDALKKACSLLGIGLHLYMPKSVQQNIPQTYPSSANSTIAATPSMGKPSTPAGPSVTPAVSTAKPQTSASIPTQKQASTVSKSSGGNGKNGNNGGGNGKTDINNIIKRW